MRILLPSNLHLQRVSINRPFPLSLSPAALPTLELQWLDLSEHPSISPSSGTLHLKSGESGRIPLPPLLSPLSTCASISGGAPHHEAEGQPMTASATAGAEREVRGDSSYTETVQHEADWSLAREYSHGLISLLQSSAAAAAEVDTEGPAVTLMEARALACICDRALGVLRAARERLAAAQQGAQQWVTTGAAHETGTIKVPWPVQEVSTHRDSACTILIQPEDLSHLPALLAPVVALATPVPAAPAASAAPAPAPAHSPAPPSAVATVPVVAVAPSMSHGASVAHHSLRRDWASSSLHEHHRLLRWADLPLALAAAAAALGPADAAWAAALPPLAAWPLRLPHWEETAAGAGDLVAAEEAVASAVAFGLALMRARSRGQSGSGSSSSSSACGDTLLRTWARAQMRAQPGMQAKEGSQAQAQPQPPLLEALLGAVPPTGGWWEGTVFPGAGAGIDTEQFRVVSLAPLGNPYGSSSPLVPSVPAVAAAVAAAGAAGGESTTQLRWGGSFPLITPADQARAHAVLYSHLGLVSAAVPAPAPTGQAQSQAQARAPDLMYLLPDTLPSGLPPLPSLPRLQGQEQQERGQGRGQSCGQQGQWSWESGWLALGVPPAAGEQGQWMPLSQNSASPSAAAATDAAAAAAVASVARTLAPLRVPRCPDAWTAQALGTLSPPLSYAAAVATAIGGSADQLGAVAAAEGGPALLRMLLPEGKVRTLDSDQNTVAETARDWGEVLHHHRPPRNVGNSKSSQWTREYGALTDRLSTSPGFAPAPGGSAGRYGSLFGLVGASMGGMQVLSLAASAPGLFPRYLAICSTGKTSPATAALRFVQRTALRQALARGSSAATALDAARLVGVLAYRTRSEFDARFEWSASESGVLECETYLQRAAERFRGVYDPHCYLAMSKLMDLMDLDALGGARRILDSNEGAAWRSELYLIGIKDDALIPASEMAQLAEELGPSFADRVLYDVVSSPHGHDAFLTQPVLFNPRIAHFLDLAASSGTSTVRSYQKEIDEN